MIRCENMESYSRHLVERSQHTAPVRLTRSFPSGLTVGKLIVVQDATPIPRLKSLVESARVFYDCGTKLLENRSHLIPFERDQVDRYRLVN